MDLHRVTGPDSYRDPGLEEAVIWSRLPPTRIRLASGVPSLKTVCAGRETYRCAGRVVDLRPGEFLFTGAHTDVSVETRATADGVCLYSEDLREMLGDAPFIRLAVCQDDMNAVREVAVRLQDNRDGRSLLNKAGKLKDVALQVGAEAARRYRRTRGATPANRAALIARLERAKAILASQPEADISLLAVCTEVGMSRCHFVRQFRQVYGLTPMRFRQRFRARYGSQMLLEGQESIDEIAAALGFFDASGFSKAFRREFEMAPGRYRQHHRVVSDSASSIEVETN